MQEGVRWSRTGSCWYRLVQESVAGSGLVVVGVCWCRKAVDSVCWCRKVFTGPGLVVAGICWCRKVSLVQDW